MSLADQVCQHGEVILLVRDGMPNQPVAAGTVQVCQNGGCKMYACIITNLPNSVVKNFMICK